MSNNKRELVEAFNKLVDTAAEERPVEITIMDGAIPLADLEFEAVESIDGKTCISIDYKILYEALKDAQAGYEFYHNERMPL